MRVTYGVIVCITSCIFLLIYGCVIFTKISSSLNSVNALKKAVFRFDTLFSKELCNTITSYIESQENHQDVCCDLKNKFPILNAITIRKKTNSCFVASLCAKEPLVKVNRDLILLKDGCLVAREHFDADAIFSIPDITIRLKNSIDMLLDDQTLMTIKKSIKENLNLDFCITWMDQTSIWLQDKNEVDWCIVVDSLTVPTGQDLRRYAAVKQAMLNKNIKLKKGHVWVADMRFADQIIVYGAMGVENETT